MVPQPEDLGQRESLKRGVRCQIAEPLLAADASLDLATFRGRTSVAPEEGRPNHLPLAIEKDRRVHLPRDADSNDARLGIARDHCAHRRNARLPPRIGILFGPSWFRLR